MAEKKKEAAPEAPPAPVAVTFSVDGLKAKIEEVKVIDARLAEAAGTAARRRTEAVKFVRDSAPELKAIDGYGHAEISSAVNEHLGNLVALHPIHALDYVVESLAALEAYKSDLCQQVEDLVVQHLKSTSSGSDEAAALRTQREALVTTATAMRTLFAQAGMVKEDDTAYILPSAPRGLSAGTPTGSKTNPVTSKSGRHYVKGESGRKAPAPDSEGRQFYANDTFSYLAFKYDVTSAELKAALAAAGVTSLASSWEATVTLTRSKGEDAGKTVKATMGHVVTPKADKPAE